MPILRPANINLRMNVRRVLLSFLAVFLGAAQGAAALTNKVLIIGIDGTMPSAMAVARTPNIDALKSNGCHSVRVVTHPVTHSASCWSSMFTGVWGDKHAVNDPGNSFSGNRFASYPSFFQRLESAKSSLNTLAFARWAPMLTAVPDADLKTSFTSDAAVTDGICQQLTNANPDVAWMLLLDVDSAGHASGWGPTVPNYVAAIETADRRVGQIVGALTNRVTYTNEDWLVIVQTDHGEHDHPDPERSRVIFSIYSGPSAARGVLWPAPAIVDVCATVLAHMHVPIDPQWDLDARPAGLVQPGARYGTNLIFNGDAEWCSGTNAHAINRGIPWWFDVGTTTLGIYGALAAFPTQTSPGPSNRGANFFLGGTANAAISQRIDISNLAADVEDPGVDFALSGWFGGAGAQNDAATLSARFFGQTGTVLGQTSIGNVLAADRSGVTGLAFREANGVLPAGTRYVEFELTNRVVTGVNDASADNLSFVLTARPDAPFLILAHGPGAKGWRVEVMSRADRLYVLERSSDFVAWTEVTSPEPGLGGSLTLLDTEAPPGQAFYRVLSIRP